MTDLAAIAAEQERAQAHANGGDGAPLAEIRAWPAPLAKAAYHGIAGEIVDAIAPHSEADPVALLTQLITAFGSCVGRAACFRAEADDHYTNLFLLLIGVTSKGRKGSAWGHVRRRLEAVDRDWVVGHIKAGLSSGEGLVHAVRDAVMRTEPRKEGGQQTVLVDEGVTDKRLLVLETEFAGPLRVLERDGNTLSARIREAWDTGNLSTLVKTAPALATGAHISIIGHVTADELRRRLDKAEVANGFVNRFLLFCVRRAQCLPEGGALRDEDLVPLEQDLREAIAAARTAARLERDPAARGLWRDVYPTLSDGRPGLLGAATSRAEAQVLRLSLIYALLDRARVIGRPHLEAALALWAYAEASAYFVFGGALGNPVADALWGELEQRPEGLTRGEMYEYFSRNRTRAEITEALQLLADHGRVELVMEPTGGRPTERWSTRKTRKGALPRITRASETDPDPDEEARDAMQGGA